MKVRCIQQNDLFAKGVYEAKEVATRLYLIHGALIARDYFEIIEEPKFRSSSETPDDIAVWYGNNCPDAIAGMSKEIHMLRGELHKVTGSQGALVEINRLLLPMLDNLREYALKYAPFNAVNKVDCIREIVKAGSRTE